MSPQALRSQSPAGAPIRDLDALLAGLAPALQPGAYVFVAGAPADLGSLAAMRPLMLFQEDEGPTALLSVAEAAGTRWVTEATPRFAWITLRVHSDLEAVGLTAAVAAALAEAGLPANVVAAARHDHVFVPHSEASRALAVLQALSAEAAGGQRGEGGEGQGGDEADV